MEPLDSSLHVALFAHYVARPDDDLDLGQAALLIAAPEYPDLDMDAAHHQLGLQCPRAGGVERVPVPPARGAGRPPGVRLTGEARDDGRGVPGA